MIGQTNLRLSQRKVALGLKLTPLRASHSHTAISRHSFVCRAEAERGLPSSSNTPEWVPEQAGPMLQFLEATDFKLQDSPLYLTYVQPYVESEFFKQNTGWKELPETINGRAAMIGFVAAAGSEILGSGSVLSQLAHSPQAVLVVLAVIVASSMIPIYKGTQGDYLSALRDTYSVPEGVFTDVNEKIHGRLAMLGLSALLALEVVVGRALL